MRTHYLTHPRLLFFTIVLLTISTFTRRQTASAIAYLPRNLVRTVTNPFSQPLHSLSSSVRKRKATDIQKLENEHLVRERDAALALADRLRQQLDRAHQQVEALSGIRKLIPDQRDKPLVPCNVTGWRGGATPTLTINRGTQHGVQRGQVVIHEANLVGRISSAEPNSATVSLITTQGLLLDIRVLPPVSGSEPRQALLQVQPIPGKELFIADSGRDLPIAKGDLAHLYVADATRSGDTYWPDEAAGLIVGQVVEIAEHPDDPKLRRQVYVRPKYSLQILNRVMVIVPEQ